MYAQLKDRGLELIAVNSGDSREVINKYVAEGKFSFLIGMDNEGNKDYGTAGKYGVQAYPTNYVLDSNGKVVFRSVGFNPNGMKAALDKLGVK
jgi:hypothetical protein